MKNQHFIPSSEIVRFNEEYFPRTLEPLDDSESENWTLDRIYGIITGGKIQSRFRCFCIQVKVDDGMSWAAEKVKQVFEVVSRDSKSTKFKEWTLKPASNPSALPLIADVIGREKFIQLAIRCRLVKKFHLFHIGLSVAVMTVSLAVGFFAAHKAGFIEQMPLGVVSFKGIFLLTSLVVSSLWLKNKWTMWSIQDGTPSSDRVAKEVNDAAIENSDQYREFLSAIARSMNITSFPRFVIIDNWGRLDRITQQVIELYFANYYQTPLVAERLMECWVVFEGTQGDKLSHNRYNAPDWQNTAFRDIHEYRFRPLTSTEKEKLGQKLNIPAKQLEEVAIKNICWKESKTLYFENMMRAFRQKNPKSDKIDNLDFFHLLSLTTHPFNISFSQKYIEKIKERDKIRSDIFDFHFNNQSGSLKYHPFGPPHEDEDLKFAIEEVKDSPNRKEWRILSEAAYAIGQIEKELEMPDARTGHLFWSHYWSDLLFGEREKHPYQSGWFQKLSYHLLKSEAPKLPKIELKHSRFSVVRRLFHLYFVTVDGCIRTCVFEEISHLIADAFEVIKELKDEGYKDYLADLNRLLVKCWEAYVILLDDTILATIREINREISSVSKKDVNELEEEDLLEDLFYDTLCLPLEDRVAAQGYMYILPKRKDITIDSVRDYMKIRSAWLAMLVEPVMRELPWSLFDDAKNAGVEYLRNGLDNILKRIESLSSDDSRQLSLIDLMTICNGIWCFGLRIRFEVYRLDPSEMFEPAASSQARYEIDLSSHFLDTLGKTAEILAKVRKDRFQRPEHLQNEFFFNAILSEIATNIVASLLMAYHYYQVAFLRDETQFVQKVNLLLQHINEIFDAEQFIQIESHNDLFDEEWIEDVDDSMEISAIIWRRFGMEQLYNFAVIRRIQFNTTCRATDRETRFDRLKKIGSLMEGHYLSDFFGNFAKANYRFDSQELQSGFYQNSASIAIQNHFAPNIQQCLAMGVLFHFYHFREDLTEFAACLTFQNTGEANFTDTFFGQLKEAELLRYFLRSNQSLQKVYDTKVVKAFERSIAKSIVSVKNPEMKQKLQCLMDYFELEKEASEQDQKIDTISVLSKWQNRKTDFIYPAVLSLCIRNGKYTPVLEEECHRVFTSHINDQGGNVHTILAYMYAKQLREAWEMDKIKPPLGYLIGAVEKYKHMLSAEVNADIYDMLLEHAPGNKRHFEDCARYWWETIEERESLRLTNHLRLGHFFQVFLDIFLKMRSKGLRTHGEWQGEAALSESGAIPRPIVPIGSETLVSAEFLKVGTFLHSEKALVNPDLKPKIEEVNRKAQEFLPELLEAIDRLPGLRDYIREMMWRFARRISDFSKPEI